MQAGLSIGKILADAALTLLDLIFLLFQGWTQWDGLEEAYNLMFEILEIVCYFLPMGTVSAIFTITVMILTARIIITVLKTLWDILPVL